MKNLDLISLTKSFVAINSVSQTKNAKGEWNENVMADAIADAFAKQRIPTSFITIEDDRKCVIVFKKGTTNKTIVLIAHHDTVGTEDMAGLPALDIDAMAQLRHDPAYFHGRGAGDMKAGIAVAVGLFRHLWQKKLNTNLIFISAPDEENNSAGILATVDYLHKLKKTQHLEFVGAINLDSSLGDPTNPSVKEIIAGGAVGKLLPSFYILGKATHASAPFDGISSSMIASALVSAIDSNPMLSEKISPNEHTPPPTLLKQVDLKEEYNTQLPIKSYGYFNYLTFKKTPEEVLHELQSLATKILDGVLENHMKKAKKYFKKPHDMSWSKNVAVYTYDQVFKKAKKQKDFEAKFKKFIRNLREDEPRERNLRIVEFTAESAKIPEPSIILFFSPPFYPGFADGTSVFVKGVTKQVKEFGKTNSITFAIKPVSEGISDMNYLQMPENTRKHMTTYALNNPYAEMKPEFNVQAIADISMPVVNIGPHAFFPHHQDEKVEIEYTFNQLPNLLVSVIDSLQTI